MRTALLAALVLLASSAPSLPAQFAAPATAGPSFEGWNLKYTVPAGWQIGQQNGRVHTLIQPGNQQAGSVFVAPGMYQNFDQVAVDLNKGFTALGIRGQPTAQPVSGSIRGMPSVSIDYIAQNQMGLPLQARVVAVLTPQGTGLVVLGVAQQQTMAQVGPVVDQVAQSLEVVGAPQPNQAIVASLRGRWMYYAGKAEGTTMASGGSSATHEEFVEFDGVGRYTYQSSSSVNVTTPGYTGSAGRAESSNDDGTYTVIGNTLVVRGRQGQASYDLQILGDRIIADGKTYVRAN